MNATLTPGILARLIWNFIPNFTELKITIPPETGAALQSTPFEKGPKLEDAIKRCRLFSGKDVAIRYCIQEAKRRLQRAQEQEPPKVKTELEKEIDRCNTIGKTAVQMACKREAPKRVEARRKAAASAAPDLRTPLEKAIATCRYRNSKLPQTMECIRDAKRRYAPKK